MGVYTIYELRVSGNRDELDRFLEAPRVIPPALPWGPMKKPLDLSADKPLSIEFWRRTDAEDFEDSGAWSWWPDELHDIDAAGSRRTGAGGACPRSPARCHESFGWIMKNSHCALWFDAIVRLNPELSFSLVTLFSYPYDDLPKPYLFIAVGRGDVVHWRESDGDEFRGGGLWWRDGLDHWLDRQCVKLRL